MTEILLSIFIFIFVFVPSVECFFGRDLWSTECTKERSQSDTCHFMKGFAIRKHASEIADNPEITRNMTLTALKMYCDDRFVCLENTYCYKDSYIYQQLDECIEDVFQKGPMLICKNKLKDILKTEPNKLAKCVKEDLEKADTATTDCVVIHKTGQCYLPDVQKYCDTKFVPIYKEYLSLRLHNLACDGRLRYRVGGNEQQNVMKKILEHNSTSLDSMNSTIVV